MTGISEFAREEEDRTMAEALGRAVQETMVPAVKSTNPKDAIGSNKPNYSSVPVPVLYEVGAALSEGARKYGGYNWRVAGVRASVYFDAARRHLDSWWEGENIDPDSGLSHVTKAIASLVVLRDAMLQDKLENDDRPPRAEDFMAPAQEAMAGLSVRYPNPKPAYTEREVAHVRSTPVAVNSGQVLGYDIEVMLPANDHPDGFTWAQQGSRRTCPDLALSIAQALREDGYGERVVRVMEATQRVELMSDHTEWVHGELRRPLTTVFPGDPSLTAMTEEEAAEQAAQEAEDGLAFQEALAAPDLGEDGPEPEKAVPIEWEPKELPGEERC